MSLPPHAGTLSWRLRQGIKRLIEETAINELIPVSNWAAFSEKGGVKGLVDWLPLDQITAAGRPIGAMPDGRSAATAIEVGRVLAAVGADVPVLHEHTVVALECDPAGRVVGAAVEGPEGARVIACDLVVACDGFRSRVREMAGLEAVIEPMEEGNRLFIHAVRDIKAGDELSYEYNLVIEDRYTPAIKKLYACRCGTRKCQGTFLAKRRTRNRPHGNGRYFARHPARGGAGAFLGPPLRCRDRRPPRLSRGWPAPPLR